MKATYVNFQNRHMAFSERKETFLKWTSERITSKKSRQFKRWKLESLRLRILGFKGQFLGTDCEVNSKGHKLKSVPASTGIKFLFSNE